MDEKWSNMRRERSRLNLIPDHIFHTRMASTWILFTLMAAFMQAWRNAFQKQLSTTVDVYGVTLARFIFALPFAVLYLNLLQWQQPVQVELQFSSKFWLYIVIAAICQILATALMVKLFQQKNYAVGVGL